MKILILPFNMKLLQTIAISVSLVLCSCGNESKPTVVYPDSTNNEQNAQRELDTTLVLNGELPIHFKKTDYLLFPIGTIKSSTRGLTKLYSGSVSNGDFSLSMGYLSEYNYIGNLDNLKIQHLDSLKFRSITNKNLKIRSFKFLESIQKEAGINLLVLNITDIDTNKDGELNDDDVESLYLSHISGRNFKKLTNDYQELLDWRVIEVNRKLYFRTLEDIDRNGEFNKSDKIHHYYASLESEDFEAVEYFPLD
ncbi:MAG: hypothetical protein COW03_11400 [Cytophagales bacterium CG12_big_fil_rev_8_21_14_0_65_40_12]|nr:MAG: hypothetical protein COW03_11400 [Cytophagales bacterium CG12_big_fil_rev_8_21_14_0_65_40_12]